MQVEWIARNYGGIHGSKGAWIACEIPDDLSITPTVCQVMPFNDHSLHMYGNAESEIFILYPPGSVGQLDPALVRGLNLIAADASQEEVGTPS